MNWVSCFAGKKNFRRQSPSELEYYFAPRPVAGLAGEQLVLDSEENFLVENLATKQLRLLLEIVSARFNVDDADDHQDYMEPWGLTSL